MLGLNDSGAIAQGQEVLIDREEFDPPHREGEVLGRKRQGALTDREGFLPPGRGGEESRGVD